MSAFEFTPGGIKEREPDAASPAVIPAAAAVAQLKEQVAAKEAAPSKPKQRPQANVLNRRNFVKELKARLREVKRELKAKATLEDEKAELERLIAAAKAPPAQVRSISTARRSS